MRSAPRGGAVEGRRDAAPRIRRGEGEVRNAARGRPPCRSRSDLRGRRAGRIRLGRESRRGRMASRQAAVAQELDKLLGERIKGQDAALRTIARTVQASTAGLMSPDRPLGVFLLAGPSGVGKTETGPRARGAALRRQPQRNNDKHERIPGKAHSLGASSARRRATSATARAECSPRPSAAGLLRRPARRMREGPHRRDEPFLSGLRQGTLTDGEGKEVSFKNTIIMLTSNLASETIQRFTSGAAEIDEDELVQVIVPSFRTTSAPRCSRA